MVRTQIKSARGRRVAFNGDPVGPCGIYVFHTNGALEEFWFGAKPVRLAWSTSGDELFLHEKVPGPIINVLVKLVGPRSAAVEHLFLKQIDLNHFTMGHARRYDYDIALTRIPD